MIIALVTIVHVLVCFILIIAVLLQSGKGADLAGAFGGGGSQTAFGSRGPATFLSRLTSVAAITFMVTSLALSLFYNQGTTSALSRVPVEDPNAPVTTTVPATPTTLPAATPPSPDSSQAPVSPSPSPSEVPAPSKPEQKPPASPPPQQ
jgi:preprotein translocase subunit SecG